MKSTFPFSLRLSLLAVVAGVVLGPSAASAFTFGGPVTLGTGDRPDGLTSGDFNADGRPDLAVTVDNPDRVQVFFGQAGGTWSAPVGIPVGSGVGAGDIVAADYDRDGDLDLALALHNVNRLQILINNGTGSFALGPSGSTGLNPVRIATGDLNGDGRPDFATANRDDNSFTILLNGGSLTSTQFGTGQEPRDVALGDLDGDGDRDLIVTNHRDRTVSTFFNNGTGAFGGRTDYGVGISVRPEGCALADLDGDGDRDMAIATDNNGAGFLAVLRNNGNGTFAGVVSYANGGSNPGGVATGDLDGDGDIDVAMANEDSANISVMPNGGGAVFGAPTILAAGVTPDDMLVADLDGDSDADLGTPNRDSNTITLYRNDAQVPVITPSRFTVTRGQLQSGQLSDLFASDDRRVVIQQRFPFLVSDPNAAIEVEGAATVDSPASLTFRVEAQCNASPLSRIIQRVDLFDFSSNAWVTLDERNPTLTDSVVDVVISQNAARFVQQGTRLMRSRVSWFDRGSVTLGWVSAVDQTIWIVR